MNFDALLFVQRRGMMWWCMPFVFYLQSFRFGTIILTIVFQFGISRRVLPSNYQITLDIRRSQVVNVKFIHGFAPRLHLLLPITIWHLSRGVLLQYFFLRFLTNAYQMTFLDFALKLSGSYLHLWNKIWIRDRFVMLPFENPLICMWAIEIINFVFISLHIPDFLLYCMFIKSW